MIGWRQIVGSIAACALTAPPAGTAQPAAKLPRVALVFNAIPLADMAGPDPVNVWARAFMHGLRDLGYVEGRNIVIERRSDGGRPEHMPALMKELVGHPVDVIVTAGSGAQDAQRATDMIPIVVRIDDAVSTGLTAGLARPSGNITGVTSTAGPAIHGKRLQLLKEATPTSTRFAVIDFKYVDSRETPGTHVRRFESEAAARVLGLTLITVGVDKREEFEHAFSIITKARADALVAIGTPITDTHVDLIIDFAARRRLPAIYSGRAAAESGGLMSYGTNGVEQWRRMAAYVDKILKGAKPADLPFEQPTKFELVINRKTAKALGLTIPQSLLLRADEVIE